jgi:hypothetical protein
VRSLIAATTILLLAAFPVARAEEPKKITVGEAIALAQALRSLDGHIVVIKRNGQDDTVVSPWEFASGSLRLRIASDMAIADRIANAAEQGRQAMVKEILQKAGVSELKPGAAETEDFLKQYQEVMDQPATGAQDFARIKASELKLDKNEIPVTVLNALAPILDRDVP